MTVVPFYGVRQAGIVTTQQERLMFAALDVTTNDVEELKRMLGRWAAMAARLTAGKLVSDSPVRDEQPPFDTGESMDLGPHSLTITVGFGPSLFDDRFGLAGKQPSELTAFGTIPGDAVMRAAISDGDLCIQACADDPQVVFHAIRNMVRAARGTAVLKWSQLGFGRASATGAGQTTPRNLMGFKDGTRNIHADDTAALDAEVWVPADTSGPSAWMANGSYVVARKIRMEIESWDTDPLNDQQLIFARYKDTGAPLTGGDEFTAVDYDKRNDAGELVVDINAHIRLASPEQNGGIKLLRRGYNYTDGQDPETGKLAAGLFFIAFQRDPQAQFKVLQTRLGKSDLLNEYIAHIGGGLWACPPGVSGPGDWFGKQLFS
jgi:deferrochelatase/peroxidase EfeB